MLLSLRISSPRPPNTNSKHITIVTDDEKPTLVNGNVAIVKVDLSTVCQVAGGEEGTCEQESFTNLTKDPPDIFSHLIYLFSPRAESARAVTGRRCPHSGVG